MYVTWQEHTVNWNNHFDRLKATYEKEEESNHIDNLLNYADTQSKDENEQLATNTLKKTAQANIADLAISFHESIKFIESTT